MKLLACTELGRDPDMVTPAAFARHSGLERIVAECFDQTATAAERELVGLFPLAEAIDPIWLDGMREADNSAALLDGVASLLPLLPGTADAPTRYRAPAVLSGFFARRYQAIGRDGRTRLVAGALTRASVQGRTMEAARLALLADDPVRAAALIEAAGPLRLMMTYGVQPVQALIEGLPSALLDTAYRSRLALAITHAKRGRLLEAKRLMEAAVADVNEARIGKAERRAALRDAVFVRTQIAVCSESGWPADQARAARDTLAEQPEFVAWSSVCSGIAYHQAGSLASAEAAFDEAHVLCRQIDADYQLLHLELHRAHLDLGKGRWRQALRKLREIKAHAYARYPADTALLAIAEIGRIEAMLAESRASVAHETIVGALANLRHGDGWYEPFASAFTSMARLRWHEQGLDGVLAGLESADHDMASRGIDHVAGTVRMLRAFYLALAGKHDAAAAVLASMSDDQDTGPKLWRERHLRDLVASMLAHHRGDGEAARLGADALVDRSRREGRQPALVEALLNRASVSSSDDGRRSLLEGLTLAADLGMPGILEEWRPMIESRWDQVSADLSSFAREMTTRQMTEWLGEMRSDLLTSRELSVLTGVAIGLTNKQISRELDLSVDTIKFHLKQCFRKLNAHTRSDAVTTARHANLL